MSDEENIRDSEREQFREQNNLQRKIIDTVDELKIIEWDTHTILFVLEELETGELMERSLELQELTRRTSIIFQQLLLEWKENNEDDLILASIRFREIDALILRTWVSTKEQTKQIATNLSNLIEWFKENITIRNTETPDCRYLCETWNTFVESVDTIFQIDRSIEPHRDNSEDEENILNNDENHDPDNTNCPCSECVML